MTNPMRIARRPSARGGFTIAEVLVSAVVLAIGFLALVAAFGHDTVVAQRGEEVAISSFLADEIHDMTLQMALADVLAMNNLTYSTAVLSTGNPANMADWSQKITVVPVSAADLNVQVQPAGAQAARLTVDVRFHGTKVLSQTYFLFDMATVPFTDGSG
ncbi:MAG: hypothetical protein IMZ65_00685 [Planctomycetes bacterium]|nr:hypothetical protein [Planctomycetota bacterium]